jgi:hypothetical protein
MNKNKKEQSLSERNINMAALKVIYVPTCKNPNSRWYSSSTKQVQWLQ